MIAVLLCVVAYVNDGDTLRCQDGTRIRLSGIDAPELAGHCRPGRACAPGDPMASKQALERLAIGKTLRCTPDGTSYNRVTAWCMAGRVDLSCAQVAGGYALRWDRYWRGHRCR
jgi:endonuclease YncB( thermonuclease family)